MIIDYYCHSHSTNLTVSAGVLAGGTLGVILLTFILIVVFSVCIKCVIVYRHRTKKYIATSSVIYNCHNNYFLSTDLLNLKLMKVGTTLLKVAKLIVFVRVCNRGA